MSKIRKGSIVWDTSRKEFTKVLTTPYKGEVSDQITKLTGRITHPLMDNKVYCSTTGNPRWYSTFCNRSCYLQDLYNLISRKEYLKQRADTSALKHIPFMELSTRLKKKRNALIKSKLL